MRDYTNLTGVGFFSAVKSHVCLEVARTGESLATDLTLVRFLSRVDQVVLLQVRQLCEGLRADAALEWSFASVRSQVNFQV